VIAWAIYALAIVTGPVLLCAWWLFAGARRERARARANARYQSDCSVAGIAERVERQRADDALSWPPTDPDESAVFPGTTDLPTLLRAW
jgi:hypothetical protein